MTREDAKAFMRKAWRETTKGSYAEEAYEMAIKALEQPTIESERAKGKWEITDAYPHNVYCSECHKRFAQTHWAVWEDGSLPRDFCPNCGADMRGNSE